MKKLTVIVLSLILLFSLGCTASADKFLDSPSKNTPQLVDGVSGLYLVPYSNRSGLEQSRLSKLEEAYDLVKNATSVSQLESSLTDPNLAVSDLFELYTEGLSGTIQVKMTDGTAMQGFTALLHYKGNNTWEKVSGVSYDSNTKVLTIENYDTTSGSPYAVVVLRTSVTTGDSFPWAYVALAAVCVAGAVVLGKKRKTLA